MAGVKAFGVTRLGTLQLSGLVIKLFTLLAA